MWEFCSSADGVKAFDELLTLVFEVIVNEGLQLNFNQADVATYAVMFEVGADGSSRRQKKAQYI
jgi:hypothetical protein